MPKGHNLLERLHQPAYQKQEYLVPRQIQQEDKVE